MPNKVGTGWIYIRSSAYASLPPPGTRVSPLDAGLMPKIVSPNTLPALDTAPGAHHYRFVGVEITTTHSVTTSTNNRLVELGASGTTDIVFDRCYIHGTPTGNIRRGIAMNSARTAVIDSYLSDFHEVGADSQAIGSWNGPGPFKIVNNYLEGAGENVMFGGGDPSIADLVPSDIEIRHNLFFKPLSWKVGDPSYAGINWSVKNIFELKNAQRVLVEDNIFENNWVAAQGGSAILFTVRNQSGGCPWCVVQDVTFTKNILRHSYSGISVMGTDDINPSQRTKRILIKDNVIEDLDAVKYGSNGCNRMFQLLTIASPDLSMPGGVLDLTIDHNTGFIKGGCPSAIFMGDSTADFNKHENLVFRNNIVQAKVAGTGTTEGTNTLNTYTKNHTFVRNVLIGRPSSLYPVDNFFPATEIDVGFLDLIGGDYHLSLLSPYNNAGTDGKDIGVDFDALLLATAGVIEGTGGADPSPSDTTPPVISAVAAPLITSSGATITWATDEASDSQVEYGTTTAYGSLTALNTTLVTSHSQTLSGLTASTLYHYRVKSRDAAGSLAVSGDFTFTTLAPVDTTVTVPNVIAVGLTYYVSPTGNDANNGLSVGAPWKTLNTAAMVLAAGDTVQMRAGSYSGNYFNPVNSGTSTSPITIEAYPGEIPIVTGSPTSGDTHFNISRSWIVIDGITFKDFSGYAIVLTGSNVTIKRSTFRNSPNTFIIVRSNYNVIDGNTFDTNGSPTGEGSGDAINIQGGAYNLIEGNYFTRAGHYALNVTNFSTTGAYSYHNIIRNNVIEQHWSAGIGVIQGSHHNVVEDNSIYFVGEGIDYPKPAIQIAAEANIIRRNVMAKSSLTPRTNDGLSVNAYTFNGFVRHARDNRVYNNIFYKISKAAIGLSQKDVSINANNKFLNNILYYNRTGGNSEAYWPAGNYYLTFGISGADVNNKWTTFPNGNQFLGNLILHADANGEYPDEPRLVYYDHTDYADSLAGVQSKYPAAFKQNLSKNPLYMDAEAGDFHLKSGSPGIDGGVHLAKTTSGGASTKVVPVDDPLFFSDGFGIVSGDQVRVGGNRAVQVTKVDHAAKTLTLASAISFAVGDNVSLDYAGSAPDIGIFEQASSPYRPFAVPGQFEAEDFDLGGEGVAYHDAVAGNAGGLYRTSEDVDIIAAAGNATGYVVNNIQTGEWLEYTINVSASGTYTIEAHVSNNQFTPRFHIKIDGVDITGSIPVPNTGNWNTFLWVGKSGVSISAGQHVLRIHSDQEYFNLDAIQILTQDVTPPAISAVASSGITSSAAIITWTTDEASDSQVEYGLTTAYGSTTLLDPTLGTTHSQTLSGLTANTLYHYRVKSKDAAGNLATSGDSTFTPLAAAAPTTLTATKGGSGDGTVTATGINCGTDCSETYNSGTSVTLTASASSGSSFSGWSGGECSGTGTCTVLLNATASVKATFSKTFTDDTLTAQVTPIKSAHITELRQAINTLRSNNSLSVFSFTESTLTAGSNQVRKVHITELRTALNAVYDAQSKTRPSYTDPTITAAQTVIKKAHIAEIRSNVKAVE